MSRTQRGTGRLGSESGQENAKIPEGREPEPVNEEIQYDPESDEESCYGNHRQRDASQRHLTAQSVIRHAIIVLTSGTALYTKSLGAPTPFAIPLSFGSRDRIEQFVVMSH
jgi:hypothetical protein